MVKQVVKKGGRDSNMELLRIVLMIMIIFHHCIVHGAGLKSLIVNNYHSDTLTPYYLFCNSFLIIGVNCFVLISGFYGIKLKAITVLSLILQTSFYSFFFFLGYNLLFQDQLELKTFTRALFPISRNIWWFVTAYFFVFLLSPLLNLAKTSFDKKQFAFIILVLFVANCFISFAFNPSSLGVNNGYSLISFINIYLIGQFMSTYPNFRIKNGFIVYFSCSVGIFILAYIALLYFPQRFVWKIFQYNNPLVLISSVAFFCSFLKLSFRSKFVNSVAMSVLGVYLIHEHPRVAGILYSKVKQLEISLSPSSYLTSIVLSGIAVFVACIAIEKIRSWLFEPLIRFLTELIERYNLDIFKTQRIVK